MKYWVNVPVHVTGYHGDLGDNIELVVEQLAKLDMCNSALLDYSVNCDATDDTAEFAVTVEASQPCGCFQYRAELHPVGNSRNRSGNARLGRNEP